MDIQKINQYKSAFDQIAKAVKDENMTGTRSLSYILISVFCHDMRIVRPLDSEPPACFNGSLSGAKVHKKYEMSKLLADFCINPLLFEKKGLNLQAKMQQQAIFQQRRVKPTKRVR